MSSVRSADTETLADATTIGEKDYDDSQDDASTIVGFDRKSIKSKDDSEASSLMLAKADALARYATFSGESSRTPRPALFRVIGGIVSLPSRAVNSMSSLAHRMLALCNTEMQVRGAVLANAAVIQRRAVQRGKLASTSRGLLADIGSKQRAARDKLRSVRNTLQDVKSRRASAPVATYVDLLLLLCVVLRAPGGTYSETLVWRVWETLTEELLGRDVHLIAEAMSADDCLDEDIGTLLRHLALSRLSGWKKQSAPNSLDAGSVMGIARSVAFSSETYDDYLSLNEAFFTVLLAVIDRRPDAVQEAFRDYIHLVWFKYVATSNSSASEIRFNYVLDNIAYALSQSNKRLDPSLPREPSSFIHFLTSSVAYHTHSEPSAAQTYLDQAIAHARKTLSCIANASRSLPTCPPQDNTEPDAECFNTDAMFELLRDHPAFALSGLAHPALPVLLFVAELVGHSPRACAALLDPADDRGPRGFLESLRILWLRGFLLPWDHAFDAWRGTGSGPGRWVPKEKRTYELRLATCLLLAGLAKAAHGPMRDGDREPMRALAEGICARRKVEAWFWDAAAATLYFDAHFSGLYLRNQRAVVKPSREKQAETELYGLYSVSLQHMRPLVVHLAQLDRVPPALCPSMDEVPSEHLVWLLENVPAALGCKALSSVLTHSPASADWSVALEILGAVDSPNQAYFCAALSEFMLSLHFAAARGARARTPRAAAAVRPYDADAPPEAPPLFMPHPADRLLMLLASAVRRNAHIGLALQRDANTRRLLGQLLADVEAGRFDRERGVDGRKPPPLDTEQKEWRSRTCQALRRVLDS
ncbi:hypothetical protein PsYK624_108500 [Phanerochaete sordida]|uniref:Uncharacterized protein n=1 Tax=Phanerochaete sordida TaxID=48140 RepID=A0A9P3GI22_9APHY|nr:hypothetical protein PsYK624_108500 [Phanerochaete sordida]